MPVRFPLNHEWLSSGGRLDAIAPVTLLTHGVCVLTLVRLEGGTGRERDVGMGRTMRRSGLERQSSPENTPPLA